MERGDFSAGILLEHPMEHLPPVEAAPILKPLIFGEMSTEEFRDQFAIPTPVNDDGLVDYRELVRQAREFVDPEYRWLSPFFDEHHLYWPAADYELPSRQIRSIDDRYVLSIDSTGRKSNLYEEKKGSGLELLNIDDHRSVFDHLRTFAESEAFDEETRNYFDVASQFRDRPGNKLWISRQFHNFLHLITIPAEQPSLDMMQQVIEIMKRSNKEERRRTFLSRIATDAIVIRERLDRAVPTPLPDGNTILVDKINRRVYQNPEAMEGRREWAILEILKQHNRGLVDLTTVAPLETVNRGSVEDALVIIARKLIDLENNLVKTRQNSQAIKVEIPVRGIKHTVWLPAEQEVA
jgi:hypothetical protein